MIERQNKDYNLIPTSETQWKYLCISNIISMFLMDGAGSHGLSKVTLCIDHISMLPVAESC